MIEIPLIKTKRTTLTILKPERAELIYTYYQENKSHIAPWEPERNETFYSFSSCRDRVTMAYTGFFQKQSVNFSILDSHESEIIGLCNFTNIIQGPFQACHMGYSIARKYEAQGLMSEAANAAIRYMFDTIGLHRIMANYMPHNERSARLLEKLGFKKEGYAKEYLKINGKWQDHILTSLINSSI
jgi:ribosomal-protein-alanine N-acetyltransferase